MTCSIRDMLKMFAQNQQVRLTADGLRLGDVNRMKVIFKKTIWTNAHGDKTVQLIEL